MEAKVSLSAAKSQRAVTNPPKLGSQEGVAADVMSESAHESVTFLWYIRPNSSVFV